MSDMQRAALRVALPALRLMFDVHTLCLIDMCGMPHA